MSHHVPRILVELPLALGQRLTLPRDKAHHVHTVLRLRPGAELRLFNGDGNEYTATVTAASRDAVEAAVATACTPPRESPLRLTLAQGIARGDRMDLAIAKSVELGVQCVQPLLCARGKVSLAGPRLHKKQAHWQRVADSAAEQSERLRRPVVRPARTLAQFVESPPQGLRLLLAPAAETRLHRIESAEAVTLLIGPESGFSADEVVAAARAGFAPLNLGPRVLRTETAGMAALAAIQSHWGDLG